MKIVFDMRTSEEKAVIRKHLVAARAKIAAPAAWTKGAFAKNSEGCSVPEDSEHAVCWCAVGAIRAVMHFSFDSSDKVKDEVFCEFRNAAAALEKITNKFLPSWNDLPERTHAEVLQLFDTAIAACGK